MLVDELLEIKLIEENKFVTKNLNKTLKLVSYYIPIIRSFFNFKLNIMSYTKLDFLKIFQLESDQAKQYILNMLNNEIHQIMATELLSSQIFDDSFFVNTLIAKLKNKEDVYTTIITKNNKTILKKICERLVLVMEKLK